MSCPSGMVDWGGERREDEQGEGRGEERGESVARRLEKGHHLQRSAASVRHLRSCASVDVTSPPGKKL